MENRVLVTGSIAYDVLLSYDGVFADAIHADALDQLSLSFFAQHYARHNGGTGANIAWNLRLLNGDPLLVSTAGSDGGEYLATLQERGIDTQYVDLIQDRVTATAIIGTDSRENQITFFHPGADVAGTWPDLSSLRDDIAYAIVSPRDTRLMLAAVEWCEAMRLPFIFDPGQQINAFSEDELSRCVRASAGVIVNEYEWSLISKRLNYTEENIILDTPLLIITRSEHGITTFNSDGAQTFGACKPDKVVNPTGAGDAFRAGLLKGFSSGWSLTDSCRLGAALGSKVVEIEGTLIDQLDLVDLRKRVKETYDEELPNL